jgi:hypothetical protein
MDAQLADMELDGQDGNCTRFDSERSQFAISRNRTTRNCELAGFLRVKPLIAVLYMVKSAWLLAKREK